MSAAPAPTVAGVVDVWGGAVDAILEKVRLEGVPVRSQMMEYVREPKRSPVNACGVTQLGSGSVPELLIQELRAGGADQDRAEVGAAALCLMLGGVDEAHNLVTPHSWASPTTFGGAPRYGSPVRQEAAYCHAIVHRMEAHNPGEFGFGFQNSGYWLNSAFGGSAHAIFPRLREAADGLAQSSGCRSAQRALRAMGPGRWDPHAFNSLCEEGLDAADDELLAFCGAVQGKELELLFQHVVAKGLP